MLERAGAEVVASSSSAVVALAEPGPFDVIVSDIGMPVVDGYDFLKRIRAREHGGGLPAIALTAFARAEDLSRAREAGFDEHIAKPVDPAALVATVERCVDAGRRVARRRPPARERAARARAR